MVEGSPLPPKSRSLRVRRIGVGALRLAKWSVGGADSVEEFQLHLLRSPEHQVHETGTISSWQDLDGGQTGLSRMVCPCYSMLGASVKKIWTSQDLAVPGSGAGNLSQWWGICSTSMRSWVSNPWYTHVNIHMHAHQCACAHTYSSNVRAPKLKCK